MISIKSILSTILIIKLLICSTFARDLAPTTLYAITTNENLQHSIMVVDPATSPKMVYNSTMNLPSGLNILGVSYVQDEYIGLFCIDSQQTSSYIDYNVKENKYVVENSILNQLNYNNGQGKLESAMKQHYLYPQSIQYNSNIYLPAVVEGYGELVLLEFSFSNEGGAGGQLEISTVNGTDDIDFTSTPIGGLDSQGNILVSYNSLSDNSTTFTLVNTSTNVKYHINGCNSNEIEMIYADPNTGFIYVIYNRISSVEVCYIDFHSLQCNIAFGMDPLNPNNYNYTPYFLTSDYQDVITLGPSTQTPGNIYFSNWGPTFAWSESNDIINYWASKSTKTVFAF